MIQSQYQIDFITTGVPIRLLSIGDEITADPVLKCSQGATSYPNIGAAWTQTRAAGAAATELSWSVVHTHASHADLRNYCFSAASTGPYGITGTLRVTVSGGLVWDIRHCTLTSISPLPMVPCESWQTLTAYTATGGQIIVSASGAAMGGGTAQSAALTWNTWSAELWDSSEPAAWKDI